MWIDHDGSPMPKGLSAGELVLVRFSDGQETSEPQTVLSFGSAWWHRRKWGDDAGSEIVCYRRWQDVRT